MDEALLQFYVYVYLDPRKPGNYTYGEYKFDYEPFYVGKGFGYRIFQHLKEGHQKIDTNKYKVNKIKKIIKETGKEPIIIKYKENLSENESFDLETMMITSIGRIDLETGPLTNLTDGGEGSIGFKHSEKTKKILREKKKGILLTEEHKKNISKANIGELNPMYGVHLSGEKSFWFGKKLSVAHLKKLTESHIGLQTGEKHPMNKYIYFISDGSNFWDLDKKIRIHIMKLFCKKKNNKVIYEDKIITRSLK